MLQNLLVALVVAVAAGYAAWSLAPRALRRRLASRALAWSSASSRCPQWVRARLVGLAARHGGRRRRLAGRFLGGGRRCGVGRLGACLALRGFVLRQVALLVLLPGAAVAGIVAAERAGHGC